MKFNPARFNQLHQAHHITAFTSVSAESGIPTFHDAQTDLWYR